MVLLGFRVTAIVVVACLALSSIPVWLGGGDREPPRSAATPTFTDAGPSLGFAGVGGTFFSWGDYDSDGDDDLLVDGGRLYRNELMETGTPSFVDVSYAAGLTQAYGGSGPWGDYDNDGCLDFYAPTGDWDVLWHNNCDGTFTNVTLWAGEPRDPWPSTAAAWGDYDRDGFLDLYVTGGEDWGAGLYYPDMLWHNDGDGTFSDATVPTGIAAVEGTTPSPFGGPAAYGRSPTWADFDDDGWLDLFVTNYRQQPDRLFRNQGDGTFADVAPAKSMADAPPDPVNNPDPCNRPGHGVGADWGDYDNDGDLDLVVGTLNHKDFRTSDESLLWRNNGGPSYAFTNVRGEAGVHIRPWWAQATCNGPLSTGPEGDELIVGASFADADYDGYLDLWFPEIYCFPVVPSFYYGSLFYMNEGTANPGHFVNATAAAGVSVFDTYGGAWADFDQDGDLDLVTGGRDDPLCTTPGRIHLFRNDGPAGNSLVVNLRGTLSNYYAVGARVTVTFGGTTLVREVVAGMGAHSQMNSLPLEFGLGGWSGPVQVTVRWPTGYVEGPFPANANDVVTITESSDIAPLPTAYVSGSDVVVTWPPSPAAGVQGYRLFHLDTYASSGNGYGLIAALPAGQTSFAHAGAAADPANHYYALWTDGTDWSARSPEQAAALKYDLPAGFSLVGWPLVPAPGRTATQLLQSLTYEGVQAYDCRDAADPWKRLHDTGGGDLSMLDAGQGVWVKLLAPDRLAAAGALPRSTSFNLCAGWNLVAYPSLDPRPADVALAGVSYLGLQGLDVLQSPRLRVIGATEELSAGRAYWMNRDAAGVWTVRNPAADWPRLDLQAPAWTGSVVRVVVDSISTGVRLNAFRAALTFDAAADGALPWLGNGAANGNLRFEDADGDGLLSPGDAFVVTRVETGAYALEVALPGRVLATAAWTVDAPPAISLGAAVDNAAYFSVDVLAVSASRTISRFWATVEKNATTEGGLDPLASPGSDPVLSFVDLGGSGNVTAGDSFLVLWVNIASGKAGSYRLRLYYGTAMVAERTWTA